MNVQVKKTVEITLTLSAVEAEWLKMLMQNPLTEDESPENARRRGKFFNALPPFEELR